MLPRLTLIGYRACGKSTAGRAVAALLGWPFVDADTALAERAGMSAGDHIRAHGEPAFRDLEQQVLADLLAGDRAMVLATGGGVVLREANRTLLAARGGLVVYLDAPVAVLVERLTRHAGDRPSLTGAGVAVEVPRLLAEREPLYRATAQVVLDATIGHTALAAALHRTVLERWA